MTLGLLILKTTYDPYPFMNRKKIAPSLMCCDFLRMGEQLRIFEEERIDYLHLDVMDGHFVPNFALGTDFCARLAGETSIPLDIHLMIEEPDRFITNFVQRPGTTITFHPETVYHPLRTFDAIKAAGARAGIAISPAVTLASVEPLLHHCDLVCVLTVNPGYAGQHLIPETLSKLAGLKAWGDRAPRSPEIEVDGNVSWRNIPRMAKAGADVFVGGTSSLFSREALLRDNIRRMRALLGGDSK